MDHKKQRSAILLHIYIPVVLCYLLSYSPVISYFIAWSGSLYIFYLTWFSKFAYYQEDLPIFKQIMRPIFLLQFIFCGFMALTSIFYFLDHLGYRFLSDISYGSNFVANNQTGLIAECQRLSLLGHAALVTGIILMIRKRGEKIRYAPEPDKNSYLIWLGILVYSSGIIFSRFSGFNQVAIPLMTVGISCSAVLFLKGILNKKINYLVIGGSIFLLNFVHASLSGYKEPIIINFIILGAVFFPYYKKTILYLAIPVTYILLYFLPTYNNLIRASWSGEISAEAARTNAIETLIGNDDNNEVIKETNWTFLTTRFSEIEMFTQFVEFVPKKHDYYDFEIIEQSLEVLVPRVIWTTKPNVEEISMERVYQAGVANRLSTVSAKTRPVVDSYLSFGLLGVFSCMFVYGIFAQSISNQAEKYFGGYELGTVIIFNSLFQIMWRGNNFEFMFNNIFYAYLIMWMLFYVLKTLKVIRPLNS